MSWLQSIPPDTFACPFEQKSLNVDVERIKVPQLETSWTEHMLVTPIKPNRFPHSAMPSTRSKAATDIMTRSLNIKGSNQPHANGKGSTNTGGNAAAEGAVDMAKSLASFHLTGKKMSDSAMDHLFKEGESVERVEAGAKHKQEPQVVGSRGEESNSGSKRPLMTEYQKHRGQPTAQMIAKEQERGPTTADSTTRTVRRDKASVRTQRRLIVRTQSSAVFKGILCLSDIVAGRRTSKVHCHCSSRGRSSHSLC